MPRTRAALLAALTLALLPGAATAQVIVRDDLDGWGWLAALRDRPVVVQLAYAASQSDATGRLDAQLLESLRGAGLQRVTGPGEFDPTKGQVMAECTGTDWIPQNTAQVQMALHAEVSYWDQSRLAATEIWEALSIGSAVPEAFTPELYVQGCTRLLVAALTRLGFDQG